MNNAPAHPIQRTNIKLETDLSVKSKIKSKKEEFINRLIAKADLDFRCCGHGVHGVKKS